MASAAEARGEKRLDDRQRESWSDETTTEREHVRVVVLARVLRRGHVITHCRADTRHLVRRHAAPDTGAVDHDADLRRAAGDRSSDRDRVVRVVDGVRARCAEIRDCVTELAESRSDSVAQRDPSVVCADSDRASTNTWARRDCCRRGARRRWCGRCHTRRRSAWDTTLAGWCD